MNLLSSNKNIRLIKKVLRQDIYFSNRLPYADEKIREVYYSRAKTTYNATEDMIKKIQSLKGKIKLKFYKNVSKYYDEMNVRRQRGNFECEEDPFSKNAKGIDKIYHELFLLMKVLQTKPSVKNMNIIYYDLYYTVSENSNENEIVNDKYENNKSEYFDSNDIIPNHYIGKKR